MSITFVTGYYGNIITWIMSSNSNYTSGTYYTASWLINKRVPEVKLTSVCLKSHRNMKYHLQDTPHVVPKRGQVHYNLLLINMLFLNESSYSNIIVWKLTTHNRSIFRYLSYAPTSLDWLLFPIFMYAVLSYVSRTFFYNNVTGTRWMRGDND